MAHRSATSAGFGTSSTMTSFEWDDLRREAKRLEGELDVKIATYANLCAGFDGSGSHLHTAGGSSAGSSTDQLLRSKTAELEGLLQRLSDVNERMGGTVSSGDDRWRMLTRHRDILQDLNTELHRLNSSVGAARERAELLSGASEGTPLMSVHVQGALLRERNTIASSTSALDDVIGTAQVVSSDLKAQRGVFEGIQDRLHNVGSRFPVVNNLLKAISRRKSRDTIILSSVIAGCILLLIIYVWWR